MDLAANFTAELEAKVAKQLKLSRNTLYRKLHRLGIETASRENYQ